MLIVVFLSLVVVVFWSILLSSGISDLLFLREKCFWLMNLVCRKVLNVLVLLSLCSMCSCLLWLGFWYLILIFFWN